MIRNLSRLGCLDTEAPFYATALLGVIGVAGVAKGRVTTMAEIFFPSAGIKRYS